MGWFQMKKEKIRLRGWDTSQVRRAYITTAIIWLSTTIGAVFLTGACYVYTWIRYPTPAVTLHPYSPHARTTALHTLSPSAAASLFGEFDKLEVSRMFLYQPWVGFSERPFHSPLFNIDEGEPLPIRRTIEAVEVAKNNKTIWLFGGSTQFGWGVPDDQTIASHLSAILSTSRTRYTVVNYGHTQFYSTQEAILFATLLRHGHMCDVAIFLDGLNDSHASLDDMPAMIPGTALGFLREEDAAKEGNSRYIYFTPLFPPVRILKGLLRRLLPKANPQAESLSGPRYNPITIYRFNMSMIEGIAAADNIHVLFYWQPTPLDYIPGAEQRRTDLAPGNENIPILDLAVRHDIKSPNFHFIADLFQNQSYEGIYVDRAHYGDTGNRMIAQVIASDLRSEGFH